MSENISLKDLLDTTFTINDKGEMVGEFTLKRINMIGDILTNYYKENERLNNIIKELEKELDEEYNTYITKNVIYGKTFKAGANVFREHMKYRLQELKHKKIYGSVESEIVYFDELGSDKE